VRPDVRRWAGWLARLCVSAGLVWWLFSRFEFSGIIASFQELSPLVWLAAALIYLAAQVLSSMRWFILSNALSFPGPWRTYLVFYFVGMYFNLFLPTSVGGDVLKIHFLSRGEGRRLMAAWSVAGDRIFGLIAMLLLGAGAAFLRPGILPGHFVTFLWIGGIVAVGGLLGLPLVQRILRGLRPTLAERLEGAFVLWQMPRRILAVLGLSLLLQTLGMGAVALLGGGIGLEIPLIFYFASLPLINLATAIPISLSGVGVREGSFVYFLGLTGVQPEQALCLGILFFSVQVAASLLGGVAYALGLHRRNARPRPGWKDIT
jgi:uncharacterized membrane protein YbhN (UPF0104 family)